VFRITDGPIDVLAVQAAVTWPGAGAVLLFAGITRDSFAGRPVTRLEYEAYPGMAVPVMARIGAEAEARWPGVRVAMVHRTGRVDISEASVVIAVSAPHRADAYAASRFAIDELKARVPVWKREHYADAAPAWKANAESGRGLPGGSEGAEP
jgi:molybdopterin synthase catalytic subunit